MTPGSAEAADPPMATRDPSRYDRRGTIASCLLVFASLTVAPAAQARDAVALWHLARCIKAIVLLAREQPIAHPIPAWLV